MATRDRTRLSGDVDRPGSIRLVRVRVPLTAEHVAAHGTESVRDVVLVGWTRTDGVVGWGECPTLSAGGYATETTDVAWRSLVEHLAPAALGRAPATPLGALALLAAPSALADARLDAALRAAGTSLRAHLGGTRPTVARCAVLAAVGAAPTELARRAAHAVDAGAAMVKVKIAPGHDHDVITAVLRAVGPVPVAADANGSYDDPAQLAALDGMGLRYLEQPFPPGLAWEDAARLHRRLATPVALDEPLVSPAAVRSALESGAADVVSVKPARMGGVLAAAEAVAAAEAAGADCFVGGMLELGIGRAGAAAVASLAGSTLPTDLGPSAQYVASDVCEPVVTDGSGRLLVPDGPGTGRTVSPEALHRFAVDDVRVERG